MINFATVKQILKHIDMALIKTVKGLAPKWGKDCYFSETAAIVGEVTPLYVATLRL